MTRPLILMTNDDGIRSPGLAAVAAALDPIADLLICAPRTQQSGTGRSMPNYDHIDGMLFKDIVEFGDQHWDAVAVNATPALAVQHGVLELADRHVDLVVSGINYGENLGIGVTISGTVGAALEGAARGIPSIAVSLEVPQGMHLNLDNSVDWSAAMHFTRFFAERWLNTITSQDVDVLKIDIPASATPGTEWQMTRCERLPYYIPQPPDREDMWSTAARPGYARAPMRFSGEDTDAYALYNGIVSVTPLSLDMTSRTDRNELRELIEQASTDQMVDL